MQMPENHRDQEKEALEAPPELIASLKQRSKTPIFVPPAVDETILGAARRHLSRQPERGFNWSLLLRWGIAAAALVVLAAVLSPALRKSASMPSSRSLSGDLNHDGQLDILDAFALARGLKHGAHPAPGWDVNGDGVVDERDVATLIARAVSLGRGGRS